MSTMTAPAYRPTFGRLLRSELRKLTSLRSTWILAGIMIGLYLLLAFFITRSAQDLSYYVSNEELMLLSSSYTVTSLFQLPLLFGVACGTMAMTAEYSHNTIQTSLLSSGSRMAFYASKLLVLLVFWAVASAIMLLLSTLLIQISFNNLNFSLPLDDIGFWISLLCCVIVLVCGVIMSASIGAVIRSTVGTVTIMYGLILILPIVEIIPLDFLEKIGPYFPINVMMSAVTPREGGIQPSFFMRDDALDANTALAVLLVYTLISVLLGALSLKKRDA